MALGTSMVRLSVRSESAAGAWRASQGGLSRRWCWVQGGEGDCECMCAGTRASHEATACRRR